MTLTLASCATAAILSGALCRRRRGWIWCAAATAGLVGLLRLSLGGSAAWVLCSVIATCAPAVVAVDMAEMRIPNRLNLTIALLATAASVGCSAAFGSWERCGWALLWAVCVGVFYLVCALIGGLGLGDVKLAAALTLAVGWLGPWVVLGSVCLAAVGGVLSALVVVARHRDWKHAFPFGPSIVLGFLAAPALMCSSLVG